VISDFGFSVKDSGSRLRGSSVGFVIYNIFFMVWVSGFLIGLNCN
jgi:hypothetical protein